jgi:hypothetical protein
MGDMRLAGSDILGHRNDAARASAFQRHLAIDRRGR